ncbi:unnamed protein product [Ilex paraguariensis]|uniref:Late embryogenesis abundant protein LEA-2 subgroup domain-containing protein n=1 Tax=Ilex paraguariensis TaxID=185542 RepID=A0ABC8RFH4_9AQUA
MPKLVLRPQRPTNPLIWCFAIICTVLAIAVIIVGIVVFVIYVVERPKMPSVSVTYAHLDNIYYDQARTLSVKISIVIKVVNDNAKAHTSFYDMSYVLGFYGVEIAKLGADPFDVRKNSSIEFNYLVKSSSIPLSLGETETVNLSLRQNRMSFDLKGATKTRWRVGLVGSVKFWLNLNCELHLPVNGSSIYPHCTTKSK